MTMKIIGTIIGFVLINLGVSVWLIGFMKDRLDLRNELNDSVYLETRLRGLIDRISKIEHRLDELLGQDPPIPDNFSGSPAEWRAATDAEKRISEMRAIADAKRRATHNMPNVVQKMRPAPNRYTGSGINRVMDMAHTLIGFEELIGNAIPVWNCKVPEEDQYMSTAKFDELVTAHRVFLVNVDIMTAALAVIDAYYDGFLIIPTYQGWFQNWNTHPNDPNKIIARAAYGSYAKSLVEGDKLLLNTHISFAVNTSKYGYYNSLQLDLESKCTVIQDMNDVKDLYCTLFREY